MKMRLIKAALATAALAVVVMGSATLHAAQNRKLDFTLVNKTGITIAEVYVSPSKDDEWGEDVMGKDVLENNKSVDITFSRSAKACKWDLKVVDEDKHSIEWTDLDLCTANEITLKYEGKKPTALIK